MGSALLQPSACTVALLQRLKKLKILNPVLRLHCNWGVQLHSFSLSLCAALPCPPTLAPSCQAMCSPHLPQLLPLLARHMEHLRTTAPTQFNNLQ